MKKKWYKVPGTNQVVSGDELQGRGINPDKEEGFEPVEFKQLSGKVPLEIVQEVLKTISLN
jgi:hypothetical protein